MDRGKTRELVELVDGIIAEAIELGERAGRRVQDVADDVEREARGLRFAVAEFENAPTAEHLRRSWDDVKAIWARLEESWLLLSLGENGQETHARALRLLAALDQECESAVEGEARA